MNNYSGKPSPFPPPQSYAFGSTITGQPSLSAPPTYYDQRRLPESIANDYSRRSQYSSFPQPGSRSQHTFDRGCLLNQSTPRAPSAENPPLLSMSRFLNPTNIDLHKTPELQPELTTKEFDKLGLPPFDLRYRLPESSVAILGGYLSELKQPSTTSVRIISREFPWNIDVTKSRTGGNITWKDMLEALYNGLHKKIEDHEWPLLILDRDPQYKVDIETFANTRINDPNRTPRTNLLIKPGVSKADSDHWSIKRIDCLGNKTTFLGFRQDKKLE